MADDISSMISVGDDQLSLADLAGLDMTDVKEVRYALIPVGNYDFKHDAGELSKVGEGEDARAVIRFQLEVINVYAVAEGVNAEEVIGKKKYQSFYIKTIDDLGRAKAFMIDCGFKGNAPLKDLLEQIQGHVFRANIVHKPDKNDPDTIYDNIKFPKKD